jgi:ubiquinone/menaquinone biosynthesis C-methylase UbiE
VVATDIFFEIHQGLPREGPGRDRYTRRAFEMLPRVEKPRILDIGCGPGGPTMELARLSGGEVIGLDTHQPYLDELQRKIESEGLEGRVKALNCSMFEMTFPDSSFDVVWSEGAIYIVGFERGLKDWRRLIAPGGFLVIHDVSWLRPDPPREVNDYWLKNYPGIRSVHESLSIIKRCGYEAIGHFTLPEDAWWIEYYGPLEARIKELREKYADDPKALEVLDGESEEIEMYKKHSNWYGSVFFCLGVCG